MIADEDVDIVYVAILIQYIEKYPYGHRNGKAGALRKPMAPNAKWYEMVQAARRKSLP